MPSSSEPGAEEQLHGLAAGGRSIGRIRMRAIREARALGHTYCGDIHVLLALLRPDTETTARQVLNQLGADYEEARQFFQSRTGPADEEGPDSPSRITPRLHGLLGAMAGVMVASDEAELTDEHALLALLYYTDEWGRTPVTELGLDPAAVTNELRQQAVWVPSRVPVSPSRRTEPSSSVVYFPEEDSDRVFPTLIQHLGGYPSWNARVSNWKPGYHVVQAEEGLSAEPLVREAVADPRTVTAVSLSEAQQHEAWEGGML